MNATQRNASLWAKRIFDKDGYHRLVGTIVQILLFGVFGIVALCGIALLVLRQSLRRRLRVHPKVKSRAPIAWLLGHSAGSRAHRRLRMATHTALRTGSESGTDRRSLKVTRGTASNNFADLGEAIAKHALETETALLHAARAPKAHRSKALQQPLHEIERIELTVAELITASAEWHLAIGGSGTQNPLDDIHERLTSIRHASAGVRKADSPTVHAFPDDADDDLQRLQTNNKGAKASTTQTTIETVIETESF